MAWFLLDCILCCVNDLCLKNTDISIYKSFYGKWGILANFTLLPKVLRSCEVAKTYIDRSRTTGPVLVIWLKLRSCCAQCLWIRKIYCHMFRVEKPKSFSRISSVLSMLLYIPRPFLQPQCFTPHPRINRLTLLARSWCSCLNLIYIKWISSVIFSATT